MGAGVSQAQASEAQAGFPNAAALSTLGDALTLSHRAWELSDSTTYTYQVIVVSGTEESEPSPALVYVSGSGYCGDGIIQMMMTFNWNLGPAILAPVDTDRDTDNGVQTAGSI
ncbi:pappalysihypothetical protein [Limosa lapponica baueri]|uniref:Uncharacterized protein n=1 Tax=Limosa lapponica baueri TaxID=1758121 RepID=A0A2I0TVG1_LIMLA|nr:pappalysihypothetical protein [Limosa lapponica baueri]